jgi:predicted PhzF superfamily epimerase YddE/YHI9
VRLRQFVVDAFTDRLFGGNPAAVVPLDRWLDDALLQRIASENNLSETAFFVNERDGLRIRWFTPGAEVKLCGHATLASAFVLMTEIEPERTEITFQSLSGPLVVRREGERFALDFPVLNSVPAEPPPGLAEALGAPPHETLRAMDWLAVYDGEAVVRSLAPDFAAIARVPLRGVIVTAPGSDVDFVSRFFAPAVGVPEDPVTGSAHCALVPYWAARLGKTTLRARQVSRRGGELWCELRGERVIIAGHAVKYLEGAIEV